MDRRDYFGEFQNPLKFDAKAMTLSLEVEGDDGIPVVLTVPARFEVCGTCDGKGVHVNPSIDAHGITSSEWAEWDYDDRESYFSGGYDVQCAECKGVRVVPVPDESKANKAILEEIERAVDDAADYVEECAAERRMGA
jgi:hypothetical protein